MKSVNHNYKQKKNKTKQIEIPFLKIYKDTVDPSIKPNEPMQISVIKSDYHKSAAINWNQWNLFDFFRKK